MNLLIDMGNTRLKWAITSNGHLMTGQPLLNNRMNHAELAERWQNIGRPGRIAISCVSKSQLLELVTSVAHELWLEVDIILVKSQAQAFGVINAYPQPDRLGVDRWLSLIAVWQTYQQLSCIVDCGTAITVDLIDAKGQHQGGLICPGLALMKNSLEYGTEALFVGETRVPLATLSNNTEDAIYNGTLLAVIGLIEHVLAKHPQNMRLILTGGDAELIAGQLDFPCIVDSDIVLRGLQYVLERQS